MARADDRRVLRVVVEDEPDPAPEPHPAGVRRGGPRAGRRRPATAVVVVSLLTLVVVLGALDARAERLERQALAAAADVPGVLGSLAEPLGEVWRLPTGLPTSALGDLVVTVAGGALVGLDGATGERRWSVPLEGPAATCPVGVPGRPGSATERSAAGGTARGSLVCFGLGRPEAARGGVIAHAVDPVDGRVRTELRGSRLLVAAVPLEQDAVLVGSGDGKVMVSRTELENGRARWAVDAEGIEPGMVDLRVRADRQVVALESTTTVVLAAADGRRLGRWVAGSDGITPSSARVVSHPGAGFGVWESRFSGRWYAPDGTPGAALSGEPVEPQVDDGRTPGVVLLGTPAGDRVRAVDVASGERRWERAAPDKVLLRLGGRLVVLEDRRLEAWDAATGELRWSVAMDPSEVPHLGAPWTDGVRLVVRGEDDDGPRLAAYRLADGERVWTGPLPAGSRAVVVLGDRLAVVGRLDGRVESLAVLG